MFEIEKKFILTEAQKIKLVKDSEFLSKKTFTDTYYDSDDFSLTLKDYWLRFREEALELKIPLNFKNDTFINQYEELTEEDKIREALCIKKENGLVKDLNKKGYFPFCVCKTTREKYKQGIFTIDIDFVEFGDFNYSLAEVELLLDSQEEVEKAFEKINNFAKMQNLKMESVKGKVIEYLYKKKPAHYKALLKKGILHPFENEL